MLILHAHIAHKARNIWKYLLNVECDKGLADLDPVILRDSGAAQPGPLLGLKSVLNGSNIFSLLQTENLNIF